jgi:hypothetical protein
MSKEAIKFIRASKAVAEQEINTVLEKFKTETGLQIISCEVKSYRCSDMSVVGERRIYSGVILEVELL